MKSLLLFLIVLLLAVPVRAQLPGSAVPDGLGVNIHFTDEQPGELEQIARMGVKLVRMDFDWVKVETAKGEYNFDAYDRLMLGLDRHGLRPIFILDYAHPLYDDNRSPDTDAGRAAIARFAAAGARHFRGRKVIWEMYNEPNIAPFWRPTPNVSDYIKLAQTAAAAIREADPAATIIGPATSGIDFDFLQTCIAARLHKDFAGLSVHPYRQRDPETVVEDYRRLRGMLQFPPHGTPGGGKGEGGTASRVDPPNDPPPGPLPEYRAGEIKAILSSEWGYSDIWPGFDRRRQAAVLARQWLVNASQGVPVSIWYDWRDDGAKQDDAEHHFGVVEHALNPLAGNGEAPFTPKTAYQAAQTLVGQLRGMTFVRRISTGFEQDWVLLFAGDDGATAIAAWTTAHYERNLVIPTGEATFTVTNMLGETIDGSRKSYQDRVPIALTREPIYLRPQQPAAALRIAAAWSPPPVELRGRLQAIAETIEWTSTITNPLDETIGVHVSDKPIPPNDGVESIHTRIGPGQTATFTLKLPVARVASPQSFIAHLSIERMNETFAQQVTFVCTNPIEVRLQPITREHVRLSVEAPAGETLAGEIAIKSDYLPSGAETIALAGGAISKVIEMDESRPNPSELAAFLPGVDAPVAAVRYTDVSLDKNTWQTAVEGDEKAAAEHAMAFVEAAELGPKVKAVAIDYRFDAGWRYVMLKKKPNTFAGSIDRAATLGLWVKGDGSGNLLRCRFIDAADQTFQPDGPRLNFTNWRYIEFPLDGTNAGFWGGNKSGKVSYPIELDALILIDSASRQKTTGKVMAAAPMILQHRN